MQDVNAHPIFDCGPLKTACFCTYSDKNYELQCPSAEDHNILVKYGPNDFLDIDCLDNPSRNLFSLPDLTAQGIRKMAFRNCTLPPEGLDTLTSKFNLISLDQLRIVITNFENITLSSAYLGEIRTSLKQLSLEGNGLAEIPHDTFEGMANLLVLDLNSNQLTELGPRYFRHLPNLQELDLSRNMLETIAEDAFEGLTQLKRLHLWSNLLKTLPSQVFTTTTSLQSLELSINYLSYLPDGVFHSLKSLTEINLRVNNLTNISSNLFEMNENVQTIRLDSNPNLGVLPKGLFSNLSVLAEVRVFDCGLRELPGDLFRGSNNLTKLMLRDNHLTNLPDDLFYGLENLEELQLENNQIDGTSAKLFEPLHALKLLDLTNNSLKKLQLDHFKSLGILEELFIKENNISEIVGRSFSGLKNLRVLDLSHNDLTLLQDEGPSNFFTGDYGMLFESLFQLEELDLSYNRITMLQMEWLMNKSRFNRISLQHNKIDKLEYESLQTTSNEKEVHVHLDHNRITAVDFHGAWLLASTNPNSTVFIVHLAGNPWGCDCKLYDLLRYFKLELQPEVRARVELRTNEGELMMCKTPRAFRNRLITELPMTALTCPLFPPKDITACPDNCTCHYRPYGHAVIIDCARRNLTTLPTLLLPSNVDYKDQDDDQDEEEEFGALRVNGLRWNGNGSTAGGSLEVWAQENRIEKVVDTAGYERVAVLDVSGNRVRVIEWVPPKLKMLKLANNNLQELSDDILGALNETTNITFDNNPWKCNCEALTLSTFLRDHFIDKDIRCDRTGLLLRKLTQSELCRSNTITILMIVLSVLLPLLICAFLAAIYYRYQRPIKVWMFAHSWTQWLVTQEDLDEDKQYDAFMCYAHEDEDYIERILKELEGGDQPYKVCIHRRDWLPGAMIADQINDSIRQSRRTIVVLSPAFIRSEWARMEFRTAHASDLREGRARLILILLGQLDPKVLEEDADLRAYCSTKTYLKHDDPLFWKKLRYAMPHRGHTRYLAPISSPSKGKVSRLGQIIVNIDRQDLCATPTTPNPGTTPPATHVLDTEEKLLRRLDPMDFLVKGGKGDYQLQTTATA